jgi:rod shape-determining protein MreC
MMRIFDRTRRARLLVAVLLSAAIVLVTIDFRTEGDGPLDAIGRGIMSVIGPIQDGVSSALRPVGDWLAGFTQVPSLKAQVQALQEENATLQNERQQISDILRENAELRRSLGLKDSLGLKTVTVRVTGVGPSNFEQTVFVDLGQAEGIRKDMPVVAGAGLVGRVVSVGQHTARVLLLIDPSSAVAARVSTNGETGVLEGRTGDELRFDLFDSDAALTVGVAVVTSGYQGGVYPAGIPIGTISRIEPKGSSLTRRAWVRPFVDFTSLDYLLVVTGQQKVKQ